MKPARLIALVVALAAGLGAAYLMMGSKPEPVVVQQVAPAPVPSEAVLVATHDIGFGAVLAENDLKWQPWPREQVPAGTIARSLQPNAVQNYRNAIVRATFSAGEPLLADRLVKSNGSGFMAAVLPSGMRAVAIDLTDQGKSAAGGFILPNDRVDVIRTFHPDEAPSSFASETILSNIRVLAIGQNVQEKANERTVIGSTATLEMTGEQAEKVILAQRTGQLTLSLRSMADASHVDDLKPTAQPMTMTIIRSGNASQARVR
jgi:pilus assembly protein CpaB